MKLLSALIVPLLCLCCLDANVNACSDGSYTKTVITTQTMTYDQAPRRVMFMQPRLMVVRAAPRFVVLESPRVQFLRTTNVRFVTSSGPVLMQTSPRIRYKDVNKAPRNSQLTMVSVQDPFNPGQCLDVPVCLPPQEVAMRSSGGNDYGDRVRTTLSYDNASGRGKVSIRPQRNGTITVDYDD